jgi:uncharacterized protein (DUF305 family)
MQSTMMGRAVRIAAAVAATIALAGCANHPDTAKVPMGHGSPSAAGATQTGPTTAFNDADVMFVQMMIPHHQQAVDMSDMIVAKSGVDPDVTALAKQIKAAQQPEVHTMETWLNAWGPKPMPEGAPHHLLSEGMLDEEQMQVLDEATGREGQRRFVESMIQHHQGAIHLAQKEIAAGKHPEATALARHIAASQQREIDTMNRLVATR